MSAILWGLHHTWDKMQWTPFEFRNAPVRCQPQQACEQNFLPNAFMSKMSFQEKLTIWACLPIVIQNKLALRCVIV